MKRKAPTTLTSQAKAAQAAKRKSYIQQRFYAPKIARTPTGFPQRMRMTHRYSEALQRTSTTGAFASYVWRANGMFDPNSTGTGHQPSYFDQMGIIYDHFTVFRSKMSVQFIPVVASSTTNSCQVVLYLSDSTSVGVTSCQQAIEQPKASWVTLSTVSNTFGPQNRLFMGFNAWQTFGSRALSDSTLRGNTSSDPSEQSLYVFCFRDTNGAGTVALDINVVIEYEAEWTEVAQIAQS